MANKTLEINEKNIDFKITGLFPIYYHTLFGRDFLADFTKLEKGASTGDYDTMVIYQIVYALAKYADKDLPSMEEWYESFEDGFAIFEVLGELMELIQMNFVSQKKAQANKAKVASKKK